MCAICTDRTVVLGQLLMDGSMQPMQKELTESTAVCQPGAGGSKLPLALLVYGAADTRGGLL